MQTSILPLGNQEATSDCAFDYYGLRLATSALDAKIRLFRLNESTGEWASETEWRAHDAPIARISWAHPEHGALIASCSFDRTVKVWQEAERVSGSSQGTGAGAGAAPRWVERAVLSEAKGSVRDVAFAPAHFGLKLATISADSMLRIYECLEIYNVSQWQLTEELDISTFGSSNSSPTSLALPASQIPTPGPENNSPTNSDGRPGTPSLTGTGGGVPRGAGAMAGSREAESGWCLSWCKEKWWGEVVAVSTATQPVVKIIALPPAPKRPILLASLEHRPPTTSSNPSSSPSLPASSSSSSSITSISWAPMSGRSYHLLATGSRDSFVRVWKVKPGEGLGNDAGGEGDAWSTGLVGEFGDHRSSVGRVEWNITGTVLSSAGDDGQIRFWKALSNVWRKIGSFNTHHIGENNDGYNGEGEDDAMMG